MTISVPQTRREVLRAWTLPRPAQRLLATALAAALVVVVTWLLLVGAWRASLMLVAAAALVALAGLARLLHAERCTVRALTAEQRWLAAAAAQSTGELRRSRARIAAGAERERRRIERDLHDGAQQRLVALRIELELAEELVERDPHTARERLRELEHEVDEALDELRALAHGVYPPLLADRGLSEALRAETVRAALPVRVRDHGIGRHPTEVESAVYFCVLEAVQNACKHAVGARQVTITLSGEHDGGLSVEVLDDGARMPQIVPGHGIANMRERLVAVDGGIEIAPRPRGGCVVRMRVPARAVR
ncbi:histidine kinase [Conexibacter stalactiti]|uniref:histidine kinase n=1 Tax=Conexibacter stalactiti TaxID=1940611 RepID=A0ABU4HQA0_9ACTN|nr:histidine kinase [Conexibacter stalactiti]MDW5595452.1 histidine kinase [Conexibacter stalactiti]MEC5036094.1 histidine kinase [Conexibacter stalactiti]